MATWEEGDMEAALAIAAATSIREASRQTGIPLVSLHRRMKKVSGTTERSIPVPSGTERLGENMRVLAEEVRSQAVTIAAGKVAEALTDRMLRLAERMYALAEKAAGKVDRAISDPWELPANSEGKPEPHDKDGASWVRAMVGVMSMSLDKAQLLAGKPTGRQAVEGQVSTHHEYTINHILENPESRELARQLFRRNASFDLEGGREAEPIVLP